MRITSIHDKQTIERFARRNPYLFLYELGDLDDFFWPYTVWYALEDEGDMREMALFYTDVEPPVLLAHTATSPETMRQLLMGLRRALPHRFFSHLDQHGAQALRDAHLESQGVYLKMGLLDAARAVAPQRNDGVTLRQLSARDLPAIETFYAMAYPHNWFVPRMLQTGCFFGATDSGGALASVAGIHVFSPQFKVAALGNIATLPIHRGRGLAAAVTAALCTHLLAQGIVHIGLNVRADNAAAITCYENLGFARMAEYGEYMVAQ